MFLIFFSFMIPRMILDRAPYIFLMFISVLDVLAQSPPSLCTKNKKAIELYVEADNFRVRRQFGQAMEMLNEAIQKDQNFCEAYYRLALVYQDLKEYKRAINELTFGLKVTEEPRKKKVFYYDLGSTYLLIGNYEKAKEFLTLYLAEEKTNPSKVDQATLWLQTCEFGIKNRRNLNEFQ